ncbi:MAG: bifunctional folylpolyglutamate synthase/dihydrofolate synthase [Marinilabiliaceae bacterium]|nr:bifunctional folylpolyglutamate synthase/dihydrofolate synthase [Marinilabiliaceae bacterium]
MTYQETLDFLFSQLPMYQRIGKAAYKADLETTLKLDAAFDNPHKSYKTIHVAGTNGKGSVSHSLASVLQEAGYKVGLYTSPHLRDFRERIRINGDMITENAVIQFVEGNKNLLDDLKPSFFEMTVAMAFDYFRKKAVDVAVIEVGMGGRLDSTNIIEPEVSVITNIGMDHTAFLGTSKEDIAGEKGGIIKANVPVVIGQTQPETQSVFEKLANEKGTSIEFADQKYRISVATYSVDEQQVLQIYKNETLLFPDLRLGLLGQYQQKNVLTVLSAIDKMKEKGFEISRQDIYKGLENVSKNTGLIGRWYYLGFNPRIVCDTGHNQDGIEAIIKQIENTAHRELHFILGMVNDKDHDTVLSLLPKNAQYYFTRASIPRSLAEDELKLKAKKHGLHGETYENPILALTAAKKNADSNDLIFIGGSTFVVADVL